MWKLRCMAARRLGCKLAEGDKIEAVELDVRVNESRGIEGKLKCGVV